MDALHAYQQGLAALQQACQQPGDQQPEEQQPCSEQLAKCLAILLNNSAAACLGFGAYESARAYAHLALRRAPRDATTLLHLAKALDGLGRYSEAADACEAHLNALARQLQSSNSNSNSSGFRLAVTAAFTDGQRFLQSLRQRAAEAERGEYNEAGMAREAAASTTPRLERHADFIGPVQVADAGEGRGRILVTSQPVRAGQLLLAMRADALCYDSEVPASFHPPPGQQRSRAHLQLARQLPAAAVASSRLAARLSYLHANGNPVPPLPDVQECGFVPAAARHGAATGGDAERLQAGPAAVAAEEVAVAARAYAAAVAAGTSASQQARYAWTRGLLQTTWRDQLSADSQLLDGICATNVFETNPRLPAEQPATGGSSTGAAAVAALETEAGGSGLWTLAAYFNHACLDNTERYFLGDFLFVRASRDLPAGAEVTITYLNPLMSFRERARALEKRGFACGCELCSGEIEWRRRQPEKAAQEADLLDCYRVLQAQIAEEEADSSPTSSATSSTSSGSSPATPAFLSTHPEQRARRRRLATRLQELLSGLRDATRGRVWRAAALYRPYVQLAELLQSCGDFQEAAEAYEEAFGSLAQQRDGDDAAAAGAADNHDHVSTTGPLLAGEAAAAAAVAAAAVVGDRQLLSPGSAVLVAVKAAVAWSLVGPAPRFGGDGITWQEQERRREAAKQRTRLWEATARGLWCRYFGGNQELFEARFAVSLRRLRE
ncbi:hypothetical protein CHLRE_07g318250v5 [Chlamydomonas reinhardtii]|uniref:SET domain-containing protein n=1 Tax=Chlamydomonas reinhardtii TaxID=3055 RepID=A0A2K3DIU0_CHLRE|nr:uncharacterized protein CHLRE_07g318250v5 [Chlamydomonas reinhardtii]PNW80454.1 hypothetical protein CHLRE_07g318250v5 [Chlamydomonas reinhardtii]